MTLRSLFGKVSGVLCDGDAGLWRLQLQVLAAVRVCMSRLTMPPITAASYSQTWHRLGLTEPAGFLDTNLGRWQP